MDDVDEVDQVALFGVSAAEGAGSGYEINDASAPYVGFGYIEVRQKDNVVSWISNWFRKVQFSMPDENAATKKEKMEWQTPTIKGKAMGVYVDTTGSLKFKEFEKFTTYAAALAWLKGRASISTAP